MKVNPFLSGIAILMSALLAFLIFKLGRENYVVMFGAALTFLVTLIPSLAVKFNSGRLSVNLRILSFVFFFIGLIFQIVVALLALTLWLYIVLSGIYILLFLLMYINIKSKDI
ncbi:MAG: hypothetical protein K2K82_01495 [Muribaculaceae bacterium]|nr:hypothetical protein [Muribaculaceae bacterium]